MNIIVEHEALTIAMEKMDKSIAVLKNELAHIRAGRANPQLLDNVKVECYGALTPISQVGFPTLPTTQVATSTITAAIPFPTCRRLSASYTFRNCRAEVPTARIPMDRNGSTSETATPSRPH